MFDFAKQSFVIAACTALIVGCGTKKKAKVEEGEQAGLEGGLTIASCESTQNPISFDLPPENFKKVKEAELPKGAYSYEGSEFFLKANGLRLSATDERFDGGFKLAVKCALGLENQPTLAREAQFLAGLEKKSDSEQELFYRSVMFIFDKGNVIASAQSENSVPSVHKSVRDIGSYRSGRFAIYQIEENLYEIRAESHGVSMATRLRHTP
jgi:hypothetical protein